MINIEVLNRSSVALSAILKGVKWGKIKASSSDIEEQIYGDITSYFTSINKVNIAVEIEDYEDIRTLSTCSLYEIEMYISFDGAINYDDLNIIENYLILNFVKEF